MFVIHSSALAVSWIEIGVNSMSTLLIPIKLTLIFTRENENGIRMYFFIRRSIQIIESIIDQLNIYFYVHLYRTNARMYM